jgi:hypothetical protein
MIPTKRDLQFNLQLIFSEMCWQAVGIGIRRIIKTLNSNRARNRTAIRTQNRTRVDAPPPLVYVYN